MPLNVQKLQEGTVIDHLAAGTGSRVLSLLSMSYPISKVAALILNAKSRKSGKKDIVKIEGVFLDEKTTNQIALISPSATINIIRNGKVESKRQVEMPKTVPGVLACPNKKCITNLERVKTTFLLAGKGQLRCRHCERLFSAEELV
ncbi:MAG: aspartate carbamoyltransferase regulatory subunit [Candidatus Anstonellaceae archaeon]